MHHDTEMHHHDRDPDHGSNGIVLTVRAVAGLSGDMMLAGLSSLAGLDDAGLDVLCAELRLPALDGAVRLVDKSVNGILGAACEINLPHEHVHRKLADALAIISNSAMPGEAKNLARAAFELLAGVEGAVHGLAPSDVTFHEVGALDSILDICLVCRLFTLVGPARFVCSPLPMADGVINCAHGKVPSPAPAVLRMLKGVPVCGFAGQNETVTPTALALLKALGARFGPWPCMLVERTVISYGTKIFADAPNGAIWALGRD